MSYCINRTVSISSDPFALLTLLPSEKHQSHQRRQVTGYPGTVMQFVFKGNFKGNSVRKGAEFFRLLLPSYRFCDTICGVKGR